MSNLLDLRDKAEPRVKVIYRTVAKPRSWHTEFFKLLAVTVIVSTIIWGVSKADDATTTADITTDPSSTITSTTPFLLDALSDTVSNILDFVTGSSTPFDISSNDIFVSSTEVATTTSEITQTESDTDTGKLVTLNAPYEDLFHPLTDILASTTIPHVFKVGDESKIHIKWKNNGDQPVTFHAYDKDGDGYLDYVEWTVPHLSEQTFEIIFISKAFQLDQDKNIIADIYDQVQAQDNNWASLTNGQYVRATFESILNDKNDNTIYAKPTDQNQPATIEVYPVYTDSDGNTTEGSLVAAFPSIDREDTYKVLLTNLQTPTDVFDLKISGNVEVDYIVDPSSGPNSPGTMADNASVGTQAWDYPDGAKVGGDGDVATALIGEGGCFLAGTKITTGDGSYKNIEEIKVGEIVRSYDTEKKEIVFAPVIKVFNHSPEEMTGDYYLIIATENNHTIKVTVNHPIWTNGNWIDAGNLIIGDTLVDDNGNSDKVTEIEKIYEKVPTYNLEVDTYHNYFAGKILVHNKPGVYWTNVKLVKSGTIQGNNNATGSLLTGYEYVPFGSSSDLWGLSLSPSDINSSNFGFAISVTGYGFPTNYATHYLVATNFGFAIPAGATINGILVEASARDNVPGMIAQIDHMRVTVYYTEAPADPADSYWVGGTGSWSEASTHWALTSNGSADVAALPGATTNVHFDSNSGTGTVTVDSAVSVATVVMDTGNATNVTLGNTLATTGNFTVTAGTFDPATYLTTIGGTFSVTDTIKVGASTFAGNYSATPTLNAGSTVDYSLAGTQTVASTATMGTSYQNLTISGSGTKTLENAITVAGDLTISAGTLDTGSGLNYAIGVAGNWTNSGTFTAQSGTVTFNGTTASHTINPGSSSFYNLTFNGVGGHWSPLTNAVTVTNDLTMNAGTFDTSNGTANVTVNGNVQCGVSTCGTIDMTSAGTNTFTQNVAANKNFGTSVSADTTQWKFYNLTFSSSSGAPTITTSTAGSGDITINGVLTIAVNTILNAGNRTWHLMGAGTPFLAGTIYTTQNNYYGTLTPNTSTFSFEGTSGIIVIASATYYNLQTSPASGTVTYTLGTTWLSRDAAPCFLAGTQIMVSAGSAQNIEDLQTGDAVLSYDMNTHQPVLSHVAGVIKNSVDHYYIINGKVKATANHVFILADYSQKSVADLKIGDALATYAGTEAIKTIERIDQPTAVYDIEVEGYHLFYAENYLVHNSIFANPVVVNNNFTLTGAGAGTVNVDTVDPSVTINGNLSIGSGQTLIASATAAFNVKGNWTNAGTFTPGTGTVTFNGASTQTITAGSSSFYNVTLNNNTFTLLTNAMTVGGNLVIAEAKTPVITATTNEAFTVTGTTNGTSGGSAETLTVNTTGAVTFTGAVGTGSATMLTALTITNSAALLFSSTINITGALTQTNAATGTTTFTGTVSVGSAVLRGVAYTVSAAFASTGSGAVAVTNSGIFTLSSTGAIVAPGGFSTSGAATISNNITTTNNTLSIGGNLILSGANVSLAAGSGAITVTGTVTRTGTPTQYKNLTASTTGAVTFTGSVSVNGLTITNSAALLFSSSLSVSPNNFVQTNPATGTTTFTGAVSVSNATLRGVDFVVNNSFAQSGVHSPMTVGNSGVFTLSSAGAITFAAGFSTTGDVNLSNNITTTNTALSIGGALTIGDGTNVTLSTQGAAGAGNITLSGTTTGTTGNSAESLTLNSGTGTISAAAIYGSGISSDTTGLTTLTITNSGAATFNNPINISGAFTQTNAATGTTTFSSTLAAGSATFRGTTINLGGTTTISGDLTIGAGTLDVTAGNYALNVGGNWINSVGSGGFTARGGTVTLTGTNQSITGSTTWYNLSKTDTTDNSTDVTLTFDHTATQTIGGLLTLQGIDDNDRVNLVSNSPGTRWGLAANGTLAINWVDTTDSDASGGSPITFTNTLGATQNNLNWAFNAAPNVPTLVSPADLSVTSDNTPTLSANYSDSDTDDTGTTNYRIATSSLASCVANTNVVVSGTSAETASNNQSTTWAPSSTIGDDGTYYWCAQNNDGVATSSWTQMGSFTLDTTASTLSFTDEVTAGPVTSDTIVGNWGDATVKKWEYESSSSCPAGAGSYSKTDANSMNQTTEANNTKYICLYGADAVGNSTTTASVYAINIDVTNPTSSIASPADNSLSSSTTVVLNGTSADTNLSTTTISVDGGSYVATAGTAAVWTYSTTSLSQGAHTFRTQATDSAGNTGTSILVHVTVDTIAPTVSIGAPSASLTKSDPITYTITYGGADAVTLANGNITLNKTSTADGSVAVSGSGTTTRTVTISSITGDGTIGISIAVATASDNAGNTALASGVSATFIVDNTAPVISLTAPSDGAYKNGAFDITYTPESGSDTCAYSTNGGSLYGTPVACSGTFSSITPGGDGDYSIKVEETDVAGNTGYSLARTLHYDTTSSIITITNPNTAPAQSKTITASTNEGTLTMSNTAGSFCDGAHGLVFVTYASQTFTSESDNTKKVCYKAVDLTTNTTYTMSDAIAGIDTTAPVITGLSDDTTAIKSKTWTWSSSDGTATFRYSIDQISGGSPSGSYSSTVTGSQSSGDGVYYIHVQAKDLAGNESAVAAVSALLDNTNPISIISTPADHSLASSTTVALSGSSSDTNLSTTTISVDGGSYVATAGTAAVWTYSATGLSQGAHTFRTRAADLVGNTGLSTVVNVTVDTTAPTVTDNVPSGWQQNDFAVTLACDDSSGGNSGCAKVYYTIDGTEPTNISSYVNSDSSWQFTEATEGDYVLKYRGLDTAGNLEDTATAGNHLRLDKTAPTVSDNVPSSWQNSDITVTLTCDDSVGGDSGCSKVFYTLDGTAPDAGSTFVDASGDWQFTYVTSTVASAVLKYRGLDATGNLEDTVTAVNALQIDKVPPVISNVSPVSGSEILKTGQTVTFTLNKVGDCRFATAAKSYDDMSGDTVCSVQNGIQMSCALPDYTTSGNEDIYLACKDYLGNKDTAESATHLTYNLPAASVTQAPTGGSSSSSRSSFTNVAPVGPFSVTINNGASTVDTREVTLKLSAGVGASAVVIADNPDFSRAMIVPYQTFYSYDLCQGRVICPDQNYTVYAKFLNAFGASSAASSATISLKTSTLIGQTGEVVQQLGQNISDFVGIFQPKINQPLNFPPIAVSVPQQTPPAFQYIWPLALSSLQDFVFAALPADLQNLVQKFPLVADTLNKVGITRMNDVGQLEVAKISLPGLAESAGLPSVQSLTVADLSASQRKKIPSNVVFARAGADNLDLNVKMSVTNAGDVAQTLNTIQGYPLTLAIKPDLLASTVKGYLIFKSNHVGMSADTSKNSLLTASVANAATADVDTAVGNADLVLNQFDYKDAGNGIWTADITSPLALGEYELRTVINYKAKTQKSAQVSMIVVVDPEGYVFEKLDNGLEARISGVSVSIYWLNPKMSQYELWPAKDYRQSNPQTTDVTGRYSFLVPPGSYYLTATGGSYDDYRGEVFQVEENVGVFANIELKAKFSLWTLFNLQNVLLGGIFIALVCIFAELGFKKKR